MPSRLSKTYASGRGPGPWGREKAALKRGTSLALVPGQAVPFANPRGTGGAAGHGREGGARLRNRRSRSARAGDHAEIERTCLVVALVAGLPGLTGIAGAADWMAQVLFALFLVLMISLLLGRGRARI